MRRMKTFLASLATGVLVVGLMLTGFLIVKVLFPGSSTGKLVMMIFCWPILFMEFSFDTTTESLVVAFLVGLVLDVVLVSLVSFIIFSARQSKRARLRPATPPPPPSF